jgi:hypothetical protein
MSNELAQQNKTLFQLADDISAYFESRQMVNAQLAEPSEDGDREVLTKQLEEIDETLDRLGAELATKTDNIAGVLRRMSAEQDLLKDEQERIHARRKTFEAAEKWLRDYVLATMQRNGMPQLKTINNTLFVRQSEAVIVDDSEMIPEEHKNVTVKMPAWYWRFMCEATKAGGSEKAKELDAIRVSEEISLSSIKRAIKAGNTVAGADVEFHSCLVLR